MNQFFILALPYVWRNFTTYVDAKLYGVEAGTGFIVGAGSIYSNGVWHGAPANLNNLNRCLYPYAGVNNFLNNCLYLVNRPGKFSWINSGNGRLHDNMVRFDNVPVGRVMHGGHWYTGKISLHGGLIYWSDDINEFYSPNYQALVYVL